MTIFGVALLALCALAGDVLGELLAQALGVKANVGGVGMAMLLLIAARLWLERRGLLSRGLLAGIGFWGALYIPIVVAMAASQNVFVAVRGGPLVVAAAFAAVATCLGAVAVLARTGDRGETMDEIEGSQGTAPSPEAASR